MKVASTKTRVPRGNTVAPFLNATRMQTTAALVHSKRTACQNLALALRCGILALNSSQAVFMRKLTATSVW